jgi:hypothetical protein
LQIGRTPSESFPDIDEAVQREFLALREYLARIEQVTTTGHGNSNGATIVMPPSKTNGQKRAWWVILQGVERLPTVAAVRDRLSRLPGCVAAQVVSLSSTEIRLSVTTTCQVDQQQLEFVISACRDVPKSQVIARNMRPVR